MQRRRADDEEPRPRGSARLVALRLLGRRDYTREELRRKLLDRGYSADDIDLALDRLREEGFQDDARAARAFVRTASHVKGRGPLRIRQELKARGLAADTISAATSDLTPDQVRAAIEQILVRKKVTRPIPLDQRQRLFQHLLRRGFPADAVLKALGGRED
ncbi:MAG: regulatory protein RecX [Acidobacteriota bacterium]